MEYLLENHDSILYTLAGVMLLLELTVLGMSGPLLFVAIGCVICGVLVSSGVVSTWEAEVLLVGVISGVAALLLWKPMKSLQGSEKTPQDNSSDMIGEIVKVSSTVTISDGAIRYSGIDWQARLNREAGTESRVEEGQSVEIVGVNGTTMMVKELN